MRASFPVVLAAVAVFVSGCKDDVLIACQLADGTPVNCCKNQNGEWVACPGEGGISGTGESGTDSAVDGTGTEDTGDDGSIEICEGAEADFSCAKRCGQYCDAAKDSCQCDEYCFTYGECCADYFDVCEDAVIDPPDDTAEDTGETGPDDYEFPAPFDVLKLSYNDCRGIATENSSWCDTYDCRGIAKWNYNPCTTKDCKGIASANKSFCDSYDCRGIADSRLCKLNRDECEKTGDKSECKKVFDECVNDARAWCKSWTCRAIVTGDAGYCSSGGFDNGNCKAVVKHNASYCFYGGGDQD